MTQFPDLFSALAAQFDPKEVRARTQAGRQLHYITARTAMNRLDSVVGPENWWDSYVAGEHSVLCQLTIRLPDGSLLTKADAGGYAGMPDQGDDDKSGYSDSFKRAAVKFGVGRYLYRDGVPAFARPEPGPGPGAQVAKASTSTAPAKSAPSQAGPPSRPEVAAGGQHAPSKADGASPPRSGRGFFAWVKEQEQRYEVGLLRYLNGWAKLQDFPSRMVDWDLDQVDQAHAEAVRKLQSIGQSVPTKGDAYEDAA